jgi:coenzyme F420-reducing hydrogenase alpha subunit
MYIWSTSIRGKETRFNVTPKAGRRVGHAEAPKGTLIDEYTTDENGLIEKANIIVDTIHNLNIKGCEKKFFPHPPFYFLYSFNKA